MEEFELTKENELDLEIIKGGEGSGYPAPHYGRPGEQGGSRPRPEGEAPVAPEEEAGPPGSGVKPIGPTSERFRGSGPFSKNKVAGMKELGGGINKCYKVQIAGDGKGVLKFQDDEGTDEHLRDFKRAVLEATGTDLDACSQMHRELLASEIDDILKSDLVPKTVSKEVEGRVASVQKFVPDLKLGFRNIVAFGKPGVESTLYDAMVFDRLIGSCDRHAKNVGVQLKRKIKFIDNGYTFAKNPDKAWNGDFFTMARKTGYDFNLKEDSNEYAITAKKFSDRAYRSKKTIDRLFEEHGLPHGERQAFWDRATELKSRGAAAV